MKPSVKAQEKVYVVILEDRHADVQVEVFRDRERTIARAAAITAEYEPLPEEQDDVPGWLYNRRLSEEGDAICVREVVLN